MLIETKVQCLILLNILKKQRNKSAVFNIIKRIKATNSVENKKKNCANWCKLSDRDKRFCLSQIENDPLLSAVDIKNQLIEIKKCRCGLLKQSAESLEVITCTEDCVGESL